MKKVLTPLRALIVFGHISTNDEVYYEAKSLNALTGIDSFWTYGAEVYYQRWKP